MKKILILLLIATILLSGCVGEKTVKKGDNISVNYIGSLENGKVFDTSIESVALENNLSARSSYKPLTFTVGKGQVIKGFDDGVIGMKVGETRNLTIPPDQGYGPINPQLIQTYPIIQEVPAITNISAVAEIPTEISLDEFDQIIGPGHKVGDVVHIPDTNINATIQNMTSTNVSLHYNLKIGDNVWMQGAPWNQTMEKIDDKNMTLRAKVSINETIQLQGIPWNETVEKIDDKNVTLRANVSKGEIVQLRGAPWNTTIVGLDNVNITIRHNPIPETVIPGMFGQTRVRFNDTSIIMDQNQELAGKTLIFKVTLVSID